MHETNTQDTQARRGDAAAAEQKLGLNKETLRDLEAPPASDEVKGGGFIMKDTVIIPRR